MSSITKRLEAYIAHDQSILARHMALILWRAHCSARSRWLSDEAGILCGEAELLSESLATRAKSFLTQARALRVLEGHGINHALSSAGERSVLNRCR